MSKTMTRKQAIKYIELFANNLMEYVEMITGGDYPNEDGETAVQFIAGDEEKFWAALEVLKSAAK